jgi:hypothetical protein
VDGLIREVTGVFGLGLVADLNTWTVPITFEHASPSKHVSHRKFISRQDMSDKMVSVAVEWRLPRFRYTYWYSR